MHVTHLKIPGGPLSSMSLYQAVLKGKYCVISDEHWQLEIHPTMQYLLQYICMYRYQKGTAITLQKKC